VVNKCRCIFSIAAIWHLLCILVGARWFAFTAAGLIAKIALLKPVLLPLATLCTLRALIAMPRFINASNIDVWQIVASTVGLYQGIGFIAGSIKQYRLGKLTL